MELDSHLKMIMLKSQKDFSVGTDYLCKIYAVMAYQSQKNPNLVEEYLRKLYAFIWDLSKFEKPLVPLVTGRVYGSGATIAWLSHFAIASQQAQLCFPESKFGFIPTGGASYILSRLPCELGLYLALTGQKLFGTDLQAINFSHSTAVLSDYLQNMIISYINSQPNAFPVEDKYGDAWREMVEIQDAYEKDQNKRDSYEIANRLNMTSFYRVNPENSKMVVADVLYNRKIRQEAQITAPGTTYKDFGGQECQNFLVEFEESCLGLLEKITPKPLSIHQHLPAIYRCFSANTLEEVISRLMYEKENGQKLWAEQVLKNLSEKSPLGLEMIFKLIRKAGESEWSECLQNEFKMALNLSKHPDFTENAKRVLSRITSPTEWTTKFPVSKDLVEELSNNSAELQIDSKKGQLLPVKEYFRDFPHNPRCWINEISPSSYFYRRDFELESRTFLNSLGFDIRDYNLEIPVVRQKIYLQEKIKKNENEELNRMTNLANDMASVRIYIKLRNEAISHFISDPESCQAQVNKLLESKFEQAFTERMQKIRTNSIEAHKIKKRELFREMRDYIEENELIEGRPSLESVEKKFVGSKMDNVPLTFPKHMDESYLPSLVNKEYPPYTPNEDEFYTADIAKLEDSAIYYTMDTERFTKRSDLDVQEMISVFATEYNHLRIQNLYGGEETNPILDHIEEEEEKAMEENAKIIMEEEDDDDDDIEVPDLPTKPVEEKEVFEFQVDHRHSSLKTDSKLLYSAEITDLAESDDNDSVPIPVAVPKNYFSKDIEDILIADRETLVDLVEDVYVKTGCKELIQGIQLLRSKQFNYDPEAMKARRRELVNKKYGYDDYYYRDEEKSKMRKLFSNYFLIPSASELTNKMYRELEVKNSKVLMTKLRNIQENRDFKLKKQFLSPGFEPPLLPEDESWSDKTSPFKKRMKHFGTNLQLENDYLKILFEDNTYLPFNSQYNPGDENLHKEVFGFCDFKLSGDEWVTKTLKTCIDHLFERRKVEEMQLTSAELWAYDQDFCQHFTIHGVKKLLEGYLNQELMALTANRESNLSEEREEMNDLLGSVKAIDSDLQDWLNKNPEIRDTYEAYQFAKNIQKIEDPKKFEKLSNLPFTDEPYIQVLKHELEHGILGPGDDPDKYIDSWKAKELPGRIELCDYKYSKKYTLKNAKRELEKSVKIMKSLKELMKKKRYRDMIDDQQALDRILEKNKDIY